MGIGAILEVGFRILRRHWAPLLGLALLFVGPASLLTAATGVRLNSVVLDVVPDFDQGALAEGILLTEADVRRVGEALLAYLAASLAAGVLASVGALGFSAIVTADYRAQRLELSSALRITLRRTPSALVVVLLTSLVIIGLSALTLGLGVLAASLGGEPIQRGGPGAFLVILVGVAWLVAVVYLTMRWAAAFPVIVAEGVGGREALARTWHLSGDNVWRIFLVSVIAALLTALFAALVSQVLGLLIVDLLGPALGIDPSVAETTVIALGTVILAPLAPVLIAVLYFDLRARRDATG